MTISHIAVSDTGASVRAKLNATIDAANLVAGKADLDIPNLAAIADLSRPGERPALWSPGTDGNPDDMAIYADSVVDSEGAVARLVGAKVCAPRAAQRLEPGRRYLVRVKVRRRINTSDPAGDAVNISIRWLTQAKAGLSTTVSTSLTTLTTGSGVVEHQMVISTAAGTGVTALSPSGAVYFRPFVQTFGTLCATDVEVISIQDITDATAYSPDLSALTGRVTAIESETLPDRVEVLEAAYGTPRKVFFRTYGDFVAATIASSIDTVEILGYYAANDGGGQVFGRGSNVTGAVHVGSDYWERRGDSTNFRKFGAKGDGTTGDRTAMAAADAYAVAAGVRLKCTYGTYLVDDNLTLAAAVDFRGGVLKVASTKTATINGTVLSAVSQIFDTFSLGGTVKASPATNHVSYPDWWGDDGGDDLPALKAAETCGILKMQMMSRDYNCTTTWVISTSCLHITGTGKGWTPDRPVTRIVTFSGTDSSILFGTTAYPEGGSNFFVADSTIENMVITRNVVPTSNSSSPITSPAGIVHQYTLRCTTRNIHVSEHSIGQLFNGVVYHTNRDVYAFRSASGGDTEHDIFYGIWANGSAAIGFAGGNASLYIYNPTVGVGGTPTLTDSRGIVLAGAFVDTFVFDLETAFVDIPITITGSRTNSDANVRAIGNLDLHILRPINDQYKLIEILIEDIAEHGAIEITGGYGAPAASGPTHGTKILNSLGAIRITQREHHGFATTGAGFINLLIEDSKKVSTGFNVYGGGERPIVLINATDCSIEDRINAASESSAYPAVAITGTSARNYVRVSLTGVANAYTDGVSVPDTTCNHNEINCTGLSAGCLQGGGSKLKYNGSAVTTAGAFGDNNLASGVVAA